ncbi:hypothetical protein N7468_005978 [Penicillium chermesinum]|uniref:Uncharacterized protein n=1 Tax=Penicillium chermesinum TaxID=63820 RepID=A0A9W9P2N2_9EURO|nr:uncharacterized protein N7468_005978 [Penicillium chermesinum]KAJ5233022.1 hypothetical protein N7468_005978 [Penicillium chermesinum]
MDLNKDEDHPITRYRRPLFTESITPLTSEKTEVRRQKCQIFLKETTKRTRVIDPPEVEVAPTCLERYNYPIFNPNDPRHNPFLEHDRNQRESHSSSSDSQKQPREQNFPLRSLHKARSGLLAITAGWFHRSSRTRATGDETEFSRPGISSMSTEEDLAFGVDLYRTNTLPNPDHEASMEALMRVAAFAPLASIVSAPEQLGSYNYTLLGPDEAPEYIPGGNRHRLNTASRVWEMESNHGYRADCNPENMMIQITHSDSSTECGKKTVLKAPSDNTIEGFEPDMRTSEKAAVPREPQEITMYDDGSVYREQWKENKIAWIKSRDKQLFEYDGLPCGHERGSLAFSKQEALSTISSNTPHYRDPNVILSGAFVSQEHLQVPENLPVSEDLRCRHEDSEGRSVEVKIAFPALYQELVDQWKREQSPSQGPAGDLLEAFIDIHSSRHPEPSPITVLQMPEQRVLGLSPPILGEASDPSSASNESLALGLERARSAAMEDVQRPESNHSFGLHISPRSEIANRNGLGSWRRPSRLSLVSRQQPSAREPYTFTTSWQLATSPVSPCDSEFTYGAMTSPSSALWSPLDSPIDEEILFSNFLRDEFYMVDGKTSGIYPDQGGQFVKVEDPHVIMTGDGSIHSGPGLDRTSSTGRPETTRPPSLWARPRPISNIIQSMTERDGSESSDGVHR